MAAPSCSSQQQVLTEEQFAGLPLSVQRKYFSSLERLRIAEHSAKVRSSQNNILDRLSHTVRGTKSFPGRLNSLRSRVGSISSRPAITPEEAQWFCSLPEKVRRAHFSREEQVLLAGPLDDRHYHSRQPSRHMLSTPPSRPDSASSSASSISLSSLCSLSPVEEATPIKFYRPEEMATMQARRPSGPLSRRTLSFGNLSTRQSTSSAPPLLPSPLSPGFAFGNHKRATSSAPRNQADGPSAPAASAFDPNAVHYSNPEARAKLRAYLGSPQKFDEAVEFGFPSTAQSPDTETKAQDDGLLGPLSLSQDLHSFMNDDWLGFLDEPAQPPQRQHDDSIIAEDDLEDCSSDTSLSGSDSPATPRDTEDIFRRHHRPGVPSTGVPSVSIPTRPSLPAKGAASPTSGSVDLFGMREMTLRLTLTRPDLRDMHTGPTDSEPLYYGWKSTAALDTQLQSHKQTGNVAADPLALESLQLSDDMTGGMGPFGKPTGLGIGFAAGNRNSRAAVRRVWGMVTGGARR